MIVKRYAIWKLALASWRVEDLGVPDVAKELGVEGGHIEVVNGRLSA